MPQTAATRTPPAMMTDAEYVACGGSRCPHCRSQNLRGGTFEADAQGASQDVHCNDCERDWIDIHRLQGWTPA